MKVSLASTSEYSKKAAESISDLSPNAADVLITSAITSMVTDLGVVAPTSSGLLTYYDGGSNSSHTIDAYFVAPKNFNGEDKEQHKITMTYGGHVETCKGANTFAVPGIYKILQFLYENFASIPLKNLIEYPIMISNEGFKLAQPTKDYFKHSLEPMFMWHDYSSKVLSELKNNLDEGIVRLEKLSDTLIQFSNEGFQDFYYGDIANSLIETIKNEGGHVTKDDLETYKMIKDSKFNLNYKDLNIIGHAGPSIGSLMVLKYLEVLNLNTDNKVKLLENLYNARKNNYEFFGDRAVFVKKEIKNIISSPSTIHIGTSDTRNNHFSLTFSSGYGSGVLCKNTGMYFNNSLGEIELNPQGFLGDTKGERLISNMSPIIVTNKSGIFTLGSPGADRISSAIAQVLTNYIANKNWTQSINMPRYHVNQDGNVRAELGLQLSSVNATYTEEFDMYFGGVCVTGLEDDLFAQGDPRRSNVNWIN